MNSKKKKRSQIWPIYGFSKKRFLIFEPINYQKENKKILWVLLQQFRNIPNNSHVVLELFYLSEFWDYADTP